MNLLKEYDIVCRVYESIQKRFPEMMAYNFTDTMYYINRYTEEKAIEVMNQVMEDLLKEMIIKKHD